MALTTSKLFRFHELVPVTWLIHLPTGKVISVIGNYEFTDLWLLKWVNIIVNCDNKYYDI